jgi:hypothetical protein
MPHPRCDSLSPLCAFVDQLENARIPVRRRRRSWLRSRPLMRSVLRLLFPTLDLLIHWRVRFLDYPRSIFSGNPQCFSTEPMTHQKPNLVVNTIMTKEQQRIS